MRDKGLDILGAQQMLRIHDQMVCHQVYLRMLARCGVEKIPVHGWVA